MAKLCQRVGQAVPAIIAVPFVPNAGVPGVLLHGALPVTEVGGDATAGVHLLHHAVIKRGVVDHYPPVLHQSCQFGEHITPGRCILHHLPGNAVDGYRVRRNRRERAHESVEQGIAAAIDHRDLDDFGTVIEPGGFRIKEHRPWVGHNHPRPFDSMSACLLAFFR